MGEGEQVKYSKNGKCENGCRVLHSENREEKPDPYVTRAKEHAKSKLRNRMAASVISNQ